MTNYRQLAPAAYIVAFLLIFIPMFDAGMTVAPWHPGNPQWRFGIVGLWSNALMLPAVGGLIAVTAALVFGHLRTQLWLGVLSWLTALFVTLMALMFILDALQTKSAIRPEMHLSYEVAVVTAEGKLILGLVSFYLLGRACKLERWYKGAYENFLRKRSAAAPAR